MHSILFVDDEPDLLGMAKVYLEKKGDILVDTATSAADAISAMKGSSYNAVVSDYMMPGIDGIEFLKELRDSGDDTPFIIFTGRGSEEVAVEAFDSGVDSYIRKCGDAESQFSEIIQKIDQIVNVREKSERETRWTDESYKSFADIVPGMMLYIVDRDGMVIFVNRNAAEWFGMSTDETIGKNLFELYGRDQAARHLKNIRSVIETGEPFYGDLVDEVHGKKCWISASISPMRSADGTITEILGISYDISARIKAEEALKDSEAKYAETLNSMLDVVFMVDRDLNLLLVNDAFRRFSLEYGVAVPDDDISGIGIRDILPYFSPGFFNEFAEVFSSGKLLRTGEESMIGGRSVYTNTVRIPVFKDHEVSKVITIIHDLTGERKAGEDLRESEEFLRAFFESAKDGIFIKNRDLEYTHVNPYMALIFGLDPQDVIGRTDRDLLGERFQDIITLSDMDVLSGQTRSYDLRIWIGGEQSQFSLRKGPVFGEDGSVTGVCGIARDITSRKLTENSLEVANRKFGLLSKITRHDLKNKITAIMGYCELIGGEAGDNPSLKKFIGKQEASLEEMTEIIDFLNKYEDISPGLSGWINLQQEISSYIAGTDTGGVPVHVELEGLEIYSDIIFIRVFSDLINNSIMHGKTVTSIRISWSRFEDRLRILYEDNGLGVSPDLKESIFTKGFGRGTGLGLYYISEILGAIGMTIKEVGEEGKGAVFEIGVPLDICRFSVDR